MEKNWGIIGNSKIVSYLQKSLEQNSLAGAYLFYGPAGLGKSALAEKFAEEIVFQDFKDRSRATTEIYRLTAEEGKKEIGIEQVRQWRRALSLKAFSNQHKVGLISQAEKLNRESANALLKTIEEPSSKTVIIMITANWQQLLPTIVSRTQAFKFLPISSKELTSSLKDRVDSRDKLMEIVKLASGKPGLAIKLLTDQQFFEEYQAYQNLVEELLEAKVAGRLKLIEELTEPLKTLAEKSKAAEALVEHLERQLRDKLLSVYLNPSSEIKNFNKNRLLKSFKLTQQVKKYLATNASPRLALENLFINI
ncbi:MAG: hypothetical protein COU22_00370 [Candidatus Komeilibacteria bacterium CG10_big_fil_rev_8_21_14_0_10_41_13]|uniref:AAA+ ATPase domain-containing protein n=1 Tax=Candidatus Komeilibacteria bacterium CG10_big_fil_rev_8_21_14_0_10_41_13 TaxID=1974476 RepID=A0A2M6WDA0_9BACT|nr:MAG: hypothetical protein COU22_00370 [Candidatus Komeilibacteria bacterium CG10_big_fil_rev_8_21_14_0_10_41_13]